MATTKMKLIPAFNRCCGAPMLRTDQRMKLTRLRRCVAEGQPDGRHHYLCRTCGNTRAWGPRKAPANA